MSSRLRPEAASASKASAARFSPRSRTALSRITAQDAREARPRKIITDFTTQSARANRATKEKVSGVMAAGSMVSPVRVLWPHAQDARSCLRKSMAKFGPQLVEEGRHFG